MVTTYEYPSIMKFPPSDCGFTLSLPPVDIRALVFVFIFRSIAYISILKTVISNSMIVKAV